MTRFITAALLALAITPLHAGGMEKQARAVDYLYRAGDFGEAMRDTRSSPAKFRREARDLVEDSPDELGTPGSVNHGAVHAASRAVVLNDWSVFDQFVEHYRRVGFSEWGILYPQLTIEMMQAVAAKANPERRAQALGVIAVYADLQARTATADPAAIEIRSATKTYRADRAFNPVSGYVITAGPRGYFGGTGWHYENPASAVQFGDTTARSRKHRAERMNFMPWDFAFEMAWAYPETGPTPADLAGEDHSGFWLRAEVEVIDFADGDKLVVALSGDHSTKPPINMVDAPFKGKHVSYSAVPYKGNLHDRGSTGVVVVQGGKVFGQALDPSGAVVHTSTKRPLSSVIARQRYTRDGWQMLDPATGEPIDSPPVDPPGQYAPGQVQLRAAMEAAIAGDWAAYREAIQEWYGIVGLPVGGVGDE